MSTGDVRNVERNVCLFADLESVHAATEFPAPNTLERSRKKAKYPIR